MLVLIRVIILITSLSIIGGKAMAQDIYTETEANEKMINSSSQEKATVIKAKVKIKGQEIIKKSYTGTWPIPKRNNQ